MKALIISRRKLPRLGMPSIKVNALYKPNVKSKYTIDSVISDIYLKYEEFEWNVGNKDLSGSDRDVIYSTISAIFEDSSRSCWEELDNGKALEIVRESSIASHVADAYNGRDWESWCYFEEKVYLEVFKDNTTTFQETLKLKFKQGQAAASHFISDYFSTLNSKSADELSTLILDVMIKLTDNADLFLDDICYGEGMQGYFIARGEKFFYGIRNF